MRGSTANLQVNRSRGGNICIVDSKASPVILIVLRNRWSCQEFEVVNPSRRVNLKQLFRDSGKRWRELREQSISVVRVGLVRDKRYTASSYLLTRAFLPSLCSFKILIRIARDPRNSRTVAVSRTESRVDSKLDEDTRDCQDLRTSNLSVNRGMLKAMQTGGCRARYPVFWVRTKGYPE